MTKDEILNMPAGEEMDALVAEKVMSMELARPIGEHFISHEMAIDGGCPELEGASMGIEWEQIQPPRFSNDISAAWEVVEKMNDRYGFEVDIISHHPGKDYIARFWACNFDVLPIEQIAAEWINRADTAPLAICRCALLAVMEE